MKAVIVGDVHIDTPKTNRINPQTNIDIGIEKNLSCLDEAVDYAIKYCDIFIINGDIYTNRTASKFIEKAFAARLHKLTSNGIKVIINLGNHDYSYNSYSFDVHAYSTIEALKIPGIELVTEPKVIKHKGESIFVCPYLNHKVLGLEEDVEVSGYIENIMNEENVTGGIYCGHGTVEGVSFNGKYFDPLILAEPVYPQRMFKRFEWAFLSHIHNYSVMRNIVNVGSLDRLRFDEAEGLKGFAVYDFDGKGYSFIETACRYMVNLKLDLTEEEDPIAKIVESIEDIDLETTAIKITSKVKESQLPLQKEYRLTNKLKKAFYAPTPKYDIQREFRMREVEINEQATTASALQKYLETKKDISEEDKKEILKKGIKTMSICDSIGKEEI